MGEAVEGVQGSGAAAAAVAPVILGGVDVTGIVRALRVDASGHLISAVGDQAAVVAAVADVNTVTLAQLATKVNAILTSLKNAGIMANS